jgi:hypothetical protein
MVFVCPKGRTALVGGGHLVRCVFARVQESHQSERSQTMKTTKTKRNQPLRPKRFAGSEELLKIVTKLADQVHRIDDSTVALPSSGRERTLAALDDPNENEGLIRACQIQRDAETLDAGEAFFLIYYCASCIALEIYETDAQLKRIVKAIEAAEKAYGLEDGEYWPIGEAPDDVEKFRAAWDRRADVILASVFRKHGEADMGTLLLADRASFLDQIKDGRRRWQAREPILEEAGYPPGLDM